MSKSWGYSSNHADKKRLANGGTNSNSNNNNNHEATKGTVVPSPSLQKRPRPYNDANGSPSLDAAHGTVVIIALILIIRDLNVHLFSTMTPVHGAFINRIRKGIILIQI
ncbi:hypothetical protein KJE20_00599 [Pyrenophora tritici-repentis]|uniref:Uncharacterized protein n=1 Tax=Pyrenophora tritici-repentis TaxID=45151 RepID=A0A922NSA7_9PLEO|nr:hypothetical protein Ptr86124_000569 [Pyrenophora tritici-repentis]KAI1687422.1 hypothetical protein KJE20_00599 [Pyrenophora tritici-repentis]